MKKTENSQPNYVLKSQILSDEDCLFDLQLLKELKLEMYLRHQGLQRLDDDEYNGLWNTLSSLPLFHEYEKINNASWARVRRLRLRIEEMLMCGECVFLTFTFDDDVLSSTSAKTRRRYVTRFLKAYTDDFVGNLDFGAKNGREHYHAVALLGSEKIPLTEWKKGSLDLERIHQTKSNVKLAKYVSKLTNHAIKETAKRSVLIYARS